MEVLISHLQANSPASLECTTDSRGLTSIPTISTDSLSPVPMSSALPITVLPTLLLPLLPPAFPPTPPDILPPPLAPTLRALRQTPVTPARAGQRGARPRNVLFPPVASTDEAATIEWSPAFFLSSILSITFLGACLQSLYDLICLLTRHLLKLPCTSHDSYICTNHMKRCARVAPIHFVLRCRKIDAKPGVYYSIGLDFHLVHGMRGENSIVFSQLPWATGHPLTSYLLYFYVSRLRLGHCMLSKWFLN
jgi:hypothetical protein